jgi:hypothetical protein
VIVDEPLHAAFETREAIDNILFESLNRKKRNQPHERTHLEVVAIAVREVQNVVIEAVVIVPEFDASRTAVVHGLRDVPLGFNSFWLRGTPQTLEILQELGFIYHIDDVSRDEPFLINVKGKPFAVVPYTLHMNDIVDYESRHFSTQEYAGDLKAEFDMLYTESSNRRRMMSVSAHDRIAGRPSRTKVLEEFIVYAQNHPGVVFMRKDEIAHFALSSPQTIREGI